MIIRQTALAAALFASAAVHAELPVGLNFSGFGTVAFTHSSNDQADYVGGRFQPNGAGHTRSTDFGPDTRLGGQVSAQFNDQWSAVLQVVSQHQHDNGFDPKVEWANVKYQATPGLSLRAGRIALPSFLLSESRFVGYANPWAHIPIEVYSALPLTSSDGLDLTYRQAFGDLNNTFQAYYGSNKFGLPDNGSGKSNPVWGFNNTLEFGSWTLRAGFTHFTLDLSTPGLDQLFGGIEALAAGTAQAPFPSFQAVSAEATALVNKYRVEGMKSSAIALGVNYDPGNWFVMAEFVAFKGKGIVVDNTNWYASAGYRLGAFTPYLTHARTKSKRISEPGITTLTGDPQTDGGAAALTGAVNQLLSSVYSTQSTTSIGVRWDAMRNVAIKTQYDHTRLGEGSAGRFAKVQPGFERGGKVDLVTVSVDFVF